MVRTFMDYVTRAVAASFLFTGIALAQDMGSPPNSLVVDNTGQVGVGTDTPGASLEVERDDGSAQVLVDENAAVATDRTLFQIENNGRVHFGMRDSNNGALWDFLASGAFFISRIGSGATEMAIATGGNVTIGGTLTENSSRVNKTAIHPVDPKLVLKKVVDLPIAEWTYKHDVVEGVRHMGPMAEDFARSFGLGATENGISTIDTSGVALAAIQALHQENITLKKEMAELKELIKSLSSQHN